MIFRFCSALAILLLCAPPDLQQARHIMSTTQASNQTPELRHALGGVLHMVQEVT